MEEAGLMGAEGLSAGRRWGALVVGRWLKEEPAGQPLGRVPGEQLLWSPPVRAGTVPPAESEGGAGTRWPHLQAAARLLRPGVPPGHLLCSRHSPATRPSPWSSRWSCQLRQRLCPVPLACRAAVSRPSAAPLCRNLSLPLVGSLWDAFPEGSQQPRRPDRFAHRDSGSTRGGQHRRAQTSADAVISVKLAGDSPTAEVEAWGGSPVTDRAKSSQITLFTNIMANDSLLITNWSSFPLQQN